MEADDERVGDVCVLEDVPTCTDGSAPEDMLAIVKFGSERPAASAISPIPVSRDNLASRFARRQSELLACIAKVIREGTLEGEDFDALTTMLHQFAGTAGFFGQAEQGTAAAALEQDLVKAGPQAAPALLIDRWKALDVAA